MLTNGLLQRVLCNNTSTVAMRRLESSGMHGLILFFALHLGLVACDVNGLFCILYHYSCSKHVTTT